MRDLEEYELRALMADDPDGYQEEVVERLKYEMTLWMIQQSRARTERLLFMLGALGLVFCGRVAERFLPDDFEKGRV